MATHLRDMWNEINREMESIIFPHRKYERFE
jgi:hypothetical protein